MTYPDPRVAKLVHEGFVPVKVNIVERPDLAAKYQVTGAPVIVVLGGDAAERYRFEGFLPPNEFSSKLTLGLAVSESADGDFNRAAERIEGLLESEESLLVDVAAEARYLLGKMRMKASGERDAALPSWKKLIERYPSTTWARRVSYLFESS